jgi:hypothetical protein
MQKVYIQAKPETISRIPPACIEPELELWPDMDMLLEPIAWLLVVLASSLGTLANLAFYELGKQGIEVVTSRFPRIKPERWHRTRGFFEDPGG